MYLADDDIIKILKFVEESNFNSLQLICGDLNLTVYKSGYVPGQPVLVQKETADSTLRREKEEVIAHIPAKKTVLAPETLATKAKEEEGLVAIKAPMVGIFYCGPEPGAEPFVNVGSKVDEDTNVGLIEVMKVFSGVAAGVKGEIKKRLVEDSQLVEYGQTIFLVRPEEGTK